MRQKLKQLTGILLSIVMVLGMMPGMSMRVLADDVPYANLKNTTNVVKFDTKDWYLIDYDDSTVTLLTKECVAASPYNSSGSYVAYDSNPAPTVKSAVDTYYGTISTDAKTAVNGGGMFLLTTSQAATIRNSTNGADVLKCNQYTGTDFNGWWLCSQGYYDFYAAFVDGDYGDVDDLGYPVEDTLGVRPALKLNLSSVIFSSESNTFSLKRTVTYKVVNGTWSDGSTDDKTETVASGSNPADVPTGMIATEGYTGGSWDTEPATAIITENTTFTYTFTAESSEDNNGTLIVEPADDAPACEAEGLSSDDIVAIAVEKGFADAADPDLVLKLEVTNKDETVPAEEKAIAENYAASLGDNVRIGMYTDMSLFLVGGGNSLQVTDLGGRSLTVYMIVPDNLIAPAGFTRHFIVFQIHNGVPTEVGRSTTRRIPITAGRFSTYVIAYYDVADGGSGAHEHNHHICEKGHKFAYCVMQAPTTEVDGFAEWRCTQCGIYDWNDHDNADARETVTLSAYPVFNDTLEKNIKAAEAGATVSIETKRWVSVRRGVLEALAEKPGVTLTVNFEYQGTGYVLSVPGGDPAIAGLLGTEDRFFSLMTLGNTYGLTAVEK